MVISRRIWFGGAVGGGNSFAGRMDDIVVADNGFDPDGILKLYEEGPAAVWPDDILAGGPQDFVPAPPIIPNVNVNGLLVVPGVQEGDLVVSKINDFAQYVLTLDGASLQTDHIVTTNGRAADNSVARHEQRQAQDRDPG